MSMELDNSFTVPVPPAQAWDVLLDVQRIAPCMPGATVDEVDGDVVKGTIKVKLGPMSMTYGGTAKFTERDEASHSIQVEASGKEARGAGTASATIKASLAPADGGGSTLVTMHTSMNVTGRPAQFGRGVIADVGGKLVDKFAENLALQLAAGGTRTAEAAEADAGAGDGTAGASDGTAEPGAEPAGEQRAAANSSPAAATAATATATATDTAGAATAAATPAAPAAPAREESLNLVRLVGPAILKRILPIAAVAAALAVFRKRIARLLRRNKAA